MNNRLAIGNVVHENRRFLLKIESILFHVNHSSHFDGCMKPENVIIIDIFISFMF